jgi:hypothetical protein
MRLGTATQHLIDNDLGQCCPVHDVFYSDAVPHEDTVREAAADMEGDVEANVKRLVAVLRDAPMECTACPDPN